MWFETKGNDSDIVISSRIRLARNLKDVKFPGLMKSDEANRVIESVSAAVSASNEPALRALSYTDLSEKSDLEKMVLVEQHMISAEFAASSVPRGVFTDPEKMISIMVNEEDHLRMQSIVSGYDLQKAYDIINIVDNEIEKTVDYAFSEKYGYLTKCPTNAGTGMRASVMLQLPGLSISNNINNMLAAVNKLGVTVRGMYGEGSKAKAYIYQVSNQFTLGVGEEETIQKLKNVVDMLIEKERQICRTLYENNENAYKDKVSRSYGILRSAYVMTSDEFMELLPYVRMGVNMNIIDGVSIEDINRMLVEMQPAHIARTITEKTNAKERDEKRAEILRNTLK